MVPRITVTSVSGGQSSAYLAANYPSDHLLFSQVCINEPKAQPKDKKLVQLVSDRIGREFIATAEDDTILHTMLDRAVLGQRIHWVAGESFDDLISQQGWLPNKKHRYCTVEQSCAPCFGGGVKTSASPFKRTSASGPTKGRARNGCLNAATTGGSWNSRTWWASSRRPQQVGHLRLAAPCLSFDCRRHSPRPGRRVWKGKPVRFAKHNNCVGCFHRNPIMLRWGRPPREAAVVCKPRGQRDVALRPVVRRHQAPQVAGRVGLRRLRRV